MIAHISKDKQHREESVSEHTMKSRFLAELKGERCGISKIMSLCAFLHDTGKNKEKFENYIKADEETQKRLRGTIAHASTGAKYLFDKYHSGRDEVKTFSELISYTIAAHHGLFDIKDINDDNIFAQKMNTIEDYEEACNNARRDYLNDNEVHELFRDAIKEFKIIYDKLTILTDRMTATETEKQLSYEKHEHLKFYLGCFQRLLLSIMIDSDWESTSDFMSNIDTLSKSMDDDYQNVFKKAEENFISYMRNKRESSEKLISEGKMTEKEREIFKARNELQKQCVNFATKPAGIYRLPLPTGGGKTLSGLAYALEFCKKHPETERIIYVSPYISVTEQNAKVFREAVNMDDRILEHHSSVIRKEDDKDTGMLDINWDEPFICTTFVQFMNALFSDRKQSVRLMHRLINSVVIIDEIQSIPFKCINTFNDMTNFLNTICNTNIVLCTATQPKLEQVSCPILYSRPTDMISDIDMWFEKFRRVSVILPQGRKYTLESLSKEIICQTEQYKSILIVLNTKPAVKKLYNMLKNTGFDVDYLTTNCCAEHRSNKIEELQKKLKSNDRPVIVISTNLIEAGVDISFECVYRAITGTDSLAQSAGRCNRNGELESGTVYLIELVDENIGRMQELQQRTIATNSTIYSYMENGEDNDILMPEWMEVYYSKLYQMQDVRSEMDFPIKNMDTNVYRLLSTGFNGNNNETVMKQAYKTAGEEYQVIDTDTIGIIVPYKDGKNIIDNIRNATKFNEIRAQIRLAQRYTVNVNENQFRQLLDIVHPVSEIFSSIYVLESDKFYDECCGIVSSSEKI